MSSRARRAPGTAGAQGWWDPGGAGLAPPASCPGLLPPAALPCQPRGGSELSLTVWHQPLLIHPFSPAQPCRASFSDQIYLLTTHRSSFFFFFFFKPRELFLKAFHATLQPLGLIRKTGVLKSFLILSIMLSKQVILTEG